jgi:hypothetical protein
VSKVPGLVRDSSSVLGSLMAEWIAFHAAGGDPIAEVRFARERT